MAFVATFRCSDNNIAVYTQYALNLHLYTQTHTHTQSSIDKYENKQHCLSHRKHTQSAQSFTPNNIHDVTDIVIIILKKMTKFYFVDR